MQIYQYTTPKYDVVVNIISFVPRYPQLKIKQMLSVDRRAGLRVGFYGPTQYKRFLRNDKKGGARAFLQRRKILRLYPTVIMSQSDCGMQGGETDLLLRAMPSLRGMASLNNPISLKNLLKSPFHPQRYGVSASSALCTRQIAYICRLC